MRMYDPEPTFERERIPRQIPARVVPSFIQEEGIVGDWLFYNGAGDVLYDYSGQGNHGTIHGPKWTDEGLAAWGLNFESGDYVDLPNVSTIFGTTSIDSISVLVWARTSISPTDYHRAVDSWSPSKTFTVEMTDTATTHIVIHVNGSAYSIDSDAKINDGEVHQWGFTYDGAKLIAYLDGSSYGSDSSMSGSLDSPDSAVWIGMDPDGAVKTWNGVELGVLFYNRVLSGAEVKARYEDVKPLYVS